MADGCFIVYKNEDIHGDIRCDVKEGVASDEIPKEQNDLYIQIESMINVLHGLHKDDSNRWIGYTKLDRFLKVI